MDFWYLGTPYSRYPDGIEAAFTLACHQTGLLIHHGVPVFSPIAHTHPVAMLCGMNPFDLAIWLPMDRPMMRAARGLIVVKAVSWEVSQGIAHEIETFQAMDKPVVFMDVDAVPLELLIESGIKPGQ